MKILHGLILFLFVIPCAHAMETAIVKGRKDSYFKIEREARKAEKKAIQEALQKERARSDFWRSVGIGVSVLGPYIGILAYKYYVLGIPINCVGDHRAFCRCL